MDVHLTKPADGLALALALALARCALALKGAALPLPPVAQDGGGGAIGRVVACRTVTWAQGACGGTATGHSTGTSAPSATQAEASAGAEMMTFARVA